MADKKDSKEEKRSHPPLDGNAFEIWLGRMTLKLQRKGLWTYCENEVDEPDKAKADGHTVWEKGTRQTNECLYDGMTDNIKKPVKHELTPFRVTQRLKQRFVGKTYFKYAEEMPKLRRLRLDPAGNVSDHLSEVRRLMDRIAVLDKPLDDYEKPALLIGSLPAAYDNVVDTFLASHTPADPNAPPNYDQLEHALEMAYDRRQERKAANKDDERNAYTDGGGRGQGGDRGGGSDRGRGQGCARGRGQGRGKEVGDRSADGGGRGHGQGCGG